MGLTGVWFVFHASDASAHEVAKYLALTERHWLADPIVSEGLRLWDSAPDSVGHPGAISKAFQEAFLRARVPEELFDACADPALEADTWDLAAPRHQGFCRAVFATMDGLAPAGVLMAGLGPTRSNMIPGAMGMFALTNHQLQEHAHAIRKAHAFVPQQRADTLGRMQNLLHVCHGPHYPAANLLEALPTVSATALSADCGLIAVAAAM